MRTNLNSSFTHATTFLASLIGMIVLVGCGGSSSTVADTNANLSTNISISAAATIPVLDGNATQAGIYIRNTTSEPISDISYALAQNTNLTSLRLDSSKCMSIPANSSCLLPVTTPSLSAGEQGSSILVASYNGFQNKQLINYRYMSINDYTGVNFSDGSTNLYGTNDYATIYTFVGKGLSQNNVGFNVSDSSLGISGGLTNGKVDILANTIIPLEIHSNQNVTSSLVTVTPYTVTTSKQLSHSLQSGQQSNQVLQVSISPTQQANLLLSDVPVLTQAESIATLTVVNNGNQAATITNITAADAFVTVGSATNNSCSDGLSLAAGASCNYQVSLNNNYSNGSTLLTLAYNNSIGATTATQAIYYQNSKGEPMISAVATQTTFTEQVNTNQNITFNIRNTGNVPLNNVVLSPKKTLANATLTIQNNTCTSTIAANGSCSAEVNVSASNLIESGVIYLNVSGSYTGATLKNYSFMSKSLTAMITDPTIPTVTSTTPQNNDTAVSSATSITVNFSESMNPTTLNTTNIQLQKVSDSSVVATTLQGVTINNQTVTFTLSGGNLASTTEYKIVINPSQIRDANGSVMGASTSETVTNFTTIDTIAPVVSGFTPANAATNQSKTPSITLSFSEPMNQDTLNTSNITLQTYAGTLVTGYTISYDPSTYKVTINLDSTALADTTTYQLFVDQQGITDIAGNNLGSNPFYEVTRFTTGDFTAPVLSSTVPINGAPNVALESSISLTFSESMDTTTLVTPNIVLQKASDNSNIALNTPVYSNVNKTVTFKPSTNLTALESYNVVINPSQLKDVSGNAISASTSQLATSFTTAREFTISLAQTGQVLRIPTGCVTLANDCINTPVGSDGYGRTTLNGANIPFGVAWAYNGTGALIPATRFVAESGQPNCIIDNLTGLEWPKTPLASMNFVNAQAAVGTYNTNNTCGHNDWYLPTVNDLSSLANSGVDSAATWLNSQGFSGVQSAFYWSSSAVVADNTKGWLTQLSGLVTNFFPKTTSGVIWPVRRFTVTAPVQIPKTGGTDGATGFGNGVAWPSPRFVSGSGVTESCITDKLTGLMWPKNGIIGFVDASTDLLTQPDYMNTDPGANSELTWNNALVGVGNMNTAPIKLCGYSDWRLPNKVELASLVNYGKSNTANWLMYGTGTSGSPVCDGACFKNVQDSSYWSSSVVATNNENDWMVYFSNGSVSLTSGTGLNVWPVRGGQ